MPLQSDDKFAPLFFRLAVRRLLTWPAILLLTVGAGLNIWKHVWLVRHSGSSSMHPLVEQVTPSIDLFGWALILIAAPLFASFRREGTFSALRVAGLSWREIFAPIFRVLFLVCVADALLEVSAQVFFGYEPFVVDVWRLVVGLVFGLASAGNFTAWLFLLNVLRMPRVFQMVTATLLVFLTMTISLPAYLWLETLLQSVYFRYPVMRTLFYFGTPSKLHSHHFAQLWLTEFVFILLLAGLFALIAPLVYRLARSLADRTLLK